MKPITKACVLAAALAGCVLSAGCGSSYPRPSEDAVYYFLAGARLHGNVRVCWPEGQKYVTRITRADAKLAEQLAPLRDLLEPGALWPPDDPRWQDKKAVKDRAAALAKLLNDKAIGKRRKALEAIEKEIEDVPPSLGLSDEAAREAFRKRLLAALAVDGRPLGDHVAALESVARAFRDLYAKATECVENVEPELPAFGYADRACRQEVARLYKLAREAVAAEHERFFRRAAERMAAIRETIGSLDKKKQRDQYTLLDNERTYYKRAFERRIRKIQSLIRRAEDALEGAREQTDAESKRRAAFLAKQIERYQALVAEIQKRAKLILGEQNAAAGNR